MTHESVTLTAVGDIIITPQVEKTISPEAGDRIFEKVRPLLADSDITVGNLECPLSARGTPEDKEFTYRASPEWAGVLRNAGFNVLCLANNHIFDYGPLGMQDTVRRLEQERISHVGAGSNLHEASKPMIREIRGIKVALLAFTYSHPAKKSSSGCCPDDPDFMINHIKTVRQAVDVVIVSIHDGLEYIDYPSRETMRLFRSVADAGANVVLGHHPHVVQGVETYKNSLICYSLGNFVSDYTDPNVRNESYEKTALSYFGASPLEIDDLRTTESFILQCRLAGGRIADYSLRPVKITVQFVVVEMEEEEKAKFLDRVQEISKWITEPDEQILDEIDTIARKSMMLNLKRLGLKDVMFRALEIRPRHLKFLLPFLKAKLAKEVG